MRSTMPRKLWDTMNSKKWVSSVWTHSIISMHCPWSTAMSLTLWQKRLLKRLLSQVSALRINLWLFLIFQSSILWYVESIISISMILPMQKSRKWRKEVKAWRMIGRAECQNLRNKRSEIERNFKTKLKSWRKIWK